MSSAWRQESTENSARRDRRVERRVGLPSGRAVLGGLLMALAAVGTFVAYANATADDTIDVLIASRALRVGDTITAADIELVAVELPDGVRGLFGDPQAATGRQMVAAVDEGEFLQASATVVPVDGDEALEIAVSLPGNRAVSGLRAGERVDIFSTWSGDVTELIAVDARVLDFSGDSGVLSTGSDQVVVRLALADFSQVEAIVHAQAAGDITMIRSAIGTEREDVGREYRPLEGSSARTVGEDEG
ncbi:SAF domain-containing protein [Actinospongicola halichondriae]|uniref:SAF domain-containing protein n=1 Tax=Actinospongicola halichondriae TaxID=3236844 RepID=UPI003D45027D